MNGSPTARSWDTCFGHSVSPARIGFIMPIPFPARLVLHLRSIPHRLVCRFIPDPFHEPQFYHSPYGSNRMKRLVTALSLASVKRKQPCQSLPPSLKILNTTTFTP